MNFRDLRANEVECRIGQVGASGITLLLYTDARACQSVLDEAVGKENWQSKHYEVKGNLFCSVGIYNKEIGEWVWKSDCGTESYTEKEKGEASDSFKRACVYWGFGRGLYSAPTIFLTKETKEKGQRGYELKNKADKFAKYRVSTLKYENGEISKLIILENGKTCFTYEKDVNKEKLIDFIKNDNEMALKIKSIMDKDFPGKRSIDLTDKEAKEVLFKLPIAEVDVEDGISFKNTR